MELGVEISLALLLAIGFVVQWLSWKLRIPAILPLLLIGIILGPVTGWFDPDATLGAFLFPLVSLAVALILFEGSLTLRYSELRGIRRGVRGMVTYGGVLAMCMLALAARWIGGVGWDIAFLFGALTCVTGPTVITPLLRTLRPTASVANALRWEGIVLDPIGALFAVLVFEATVTHQQGHSIAVFLGTIGVGLAIGLVMAAVLAAVLYYEILPEYLHNFGVLSSVLATFAASNVLAGESGLLAVTVMGIVLGNLSRIHIDHILELHEQLSTILVSVLFVVLAARLNLPLPDGVLWAGLAIFVVAQIVIRPVSIFVATLGSQLTWPERGLLAYVSPRGVVAAAVSSLFALRLDSLGIPGGDVLVALVFILIIATVLVQSLTARPLARLLGVAAPEPTGVLIFGSDPVARAIGAALKAQKIDVTLADNNWDAISQARMEGFNTFYGAPMSRLAELHLDLTPIGTFLAISERRDLNYLACVHFWDELGRDSVYRMRVLEEDGRTNRLSVSDRLHGKVLFGHKITHRRFAGMLQDGWKIKTSELTEKFDWDGFRAQHGEDSLLLFGIDSGDRLRVVDADREVEPRNGWKVIALVPPGPDGSGDNGPARKSAAGKSTPKAGDAAGGGAR